MTLITNLYSDPNALLQLKTWNCAAQKNRNGRYVYTGNSDIWAAIIPGITSQCVVAFSLDTSSRVNFKLENCREVYRSSATLAGIYSGIGNCSLHCSNGNGVSMTVNRIGVYSQDDWNRLRQYGLDWFDGDLMPLQ